jgi:alkyldihydroxyacetonephosphate synthase
MVAWLWERLGLSPEAGSPLPRFDAGRQSAPTARDLPDLGPAQLSTDALDRVAHSRGQGTPDLLRLRSGTVRRLPDAVARPADEAQLATLLRSASRHGIQVVPWGGGTSVTGGVNTPCGDAPVVAVSLERLSGLLDLDEASGLATLGTGTLGPDLETALGKHGFTLGHFPQSFELSSLGGWIVTHSTGQESLRYGRIADQVAGLRMVSPTERLVIPALPKSSTGPDLRQWVAGSEGRFGVLSEATVRVTTVRHATRVEAAMLPNWWLGAEAARDLMHQAPGLSMLRLSDESETEVAMTVGLGDGPFAVMARGWLKLRRVWDGCLLLLGAEDSLDGDQTFDRCRSVVAEAGGVWLGRRPGRHWQRDRFRHPYLRDGLLDLGLVTDTLETAAPWSRLPALYDAVRKALREGTRGGEKDIPVLCHLSHPYEDGASLYFTFFFPCPGQAGLGDGDQAVARWADLKRRAGRAIAEAGGATSHHHGVGSWHAPWADAEWSAGQDAAGGARAMLEAVASRFDPAGILNPHALLDPTDRLED